MTEDGSASLQKELAELRAEVRQLRVELDDLGGAWKKDTLDTAGHVGSIYQYIADIHDYLMPILHKVFPNYQASKKQIDSFMKRYNGSDDSKKSR